MNSDLNVALQHFTNNCLVGKFGYSQKNLFGFVYNVRLLGTPGVFEKMKMILINRKDLKS
jgi:hypothetical protein